MLIDLKKIGKCAGSAGSSGHTGNGLCTGNC